MRHEKKVFSVEPWTRETGATHGGPRGSQDREQGQPFESILAERRRSSRVREVGVPRGRVPEGSGGVRVKEGHTVRSILGC